MRYDLPATLVFLLASTAPAAAPAKVIVVIRDRPTPPYQEALAGARAEWGRPLEVYSVGQPLPPGPVGVVITLGARAARSARRLGAPLIAALAPSHYARGDPPGTVRVAMTPSPERVIDLLKAAGVRRLLAVRASPADAEFSRRAAIAGSTAGVDIEDAVVASSDELSGVLRLAGERADGIWLVPDPDAVTPENYEALRRFTRARGMPFFAPSPGLVAEGARGELAVSFRECGVQAARAARGLATGRPFAPVVYSGDP